MAIESLLLTLFVDCLLKQPLPLQLLLNDAGAYHHQQKGQLLYDKKMVSYAGNTHSPTPPKMNPVENQVTIPLQTQIHFLLSFAWWSSLTDSEHEDT